MAKRQWGFTLAGGNYPSYLNVSEQDDGSFVVTVRSPAAFDGRCGNDAGIAISRDDFRIYVKQLVDELAL